MMYASTRLSHGVYDSFGNAGTGAAGGCGYPMPACGGW